MALSDLELLQLVERAEQGKRGPQGEPGIGIAEINQIEPGSFVITLTNGKTQRIDLVPGRDGAPGTSITGERGPEGAPGRRGEKGEVGAPGAPGRDGLDGLSIDTAIVREGDLLLGLTDGSIISAGRVMGLTGPSGERGPE